MQELDLKLLYVAEQLIDIISSHCIDFRKTSFLACHLVADFRLDRGLMSG